MDLLEVYRRTIVLLALLMAWISGYMEAWGNATHNLYLTVIGVGIGLLAIFVVQNIKSEGGEDEDARNDQDRY